MCREGWKKKCSLAAVAFHNDMCRFWGFLVSLPGGNFQPVVQGTIRKCNVFISLKQDVPSHLQHGGTQLPAFRHICAEGINIRVLVEEEKRTWRKNLICMSFISPSLPLPPHAHAERWPVVLRRVCSQRGQRRPRPEVHILRVAHEIRPHQPVQGKSVKTEHAGEAGGEGWSVSFKQGKHTYSRCKREYSSPSLSLGASFDAIEHPPPSDSWN